MGQPIVTEGGLARSEADALKLAGYNTSLLGTATVGGMRDAGIVGAVTGAVQGASKSEAPGLARLASDVADLNYRGNVEAAQAEQDAQAMVDQANAEVARANADFVEGVAHQASADYWAAQGYGSSMAGAGAVPSSSLLVSAKGGAVQDAKTGKTFYSEEEWVGHAVEQASLEAGRSSQFVDTVQVNVGTEANPKIVNMTPKQYGDYVREGYDVAIADTKAQKAEYIAAYQPHPVAGSWAGALGMGFTSSSVLGKAALGVVPFYSTVKNWNRMGIGGKAFGVGMSTAMVLPVVGAVGRIGTSAIRMTGTIGLTERAGLAAGSFKTIATSPISGLSRMSLSTLKSPSAMMTSAKGFTKGLWEVTKFPVAHPMQTAYGWKALTTAERAIGPAAIARAEAPIAAASRQWADIQMKTYMEGFQRTQPTEIASRYGVTTFESRTEPPFRAALKAVVGRTTGMKTPAQRQWVTQQLKPESEIVGYRMQWEKPAGDISPFSGDDFGGGSMEPIGGLETRTSGTRVATAVMEKEANLGGLELQAMTKTLNMGSSAKAFERISGTVLPSIMPSTSPIALAAVASLPVAGVRARSMPDLVTSPVIQVSPALPRPIWERQALIGTSIEPRASVAPVVAPTIAPVPSWTMPDLITMPIVRPVISPSLMPWERTRLFPSDEEMAAVTTVFPGVYTGTETSLLPSAVTVPSPSVLPIPAPLPIRPIVSMPTVIRPDFTVAPTFPPVDESPKPFVPLPIPPLPFGAAGAGSTPSGTPTGKSPYHGFWRRGRLVFHMPLAARGMIPESMMKMTFMPEKTFSYGSKPVSTKRVATRRKASPRYRIAGGGNEGSVGGRMYVSSTAEEV